MNSLEQVRKKIPPNVRLIAVSKGQPIAKIKEAILKDQNDFGENYARELEEKARALAGEKIRWHFLGHLQRNKLKKVLPYIEWLHSLDSYALAEAIHKNAKTPLKCLLEINLAKETTKTGLDPDEALELIPKLILLTNINLKGLMTMAPATHFPELFLLLKRINERYLYPRPLTELSMGMSNDFEEAIEAGATMVRIGTAIFGERK